MAPRTRPALDEDPQWYRDAVLYEVHVRAFQDSTGDGVGDFGGLRARLDYLQSLGVTALWILPFYPSPLRDDGYDIADYTGVHPAYGTLRDFSILVDEAHRRGLRIVTELVLNHTSDRHPWFQRARRAPPGSALREFYVWSDKADRYRDARVIFKDFETSNWAWDGVAQAYYWHRFYAHQPDLNYRNPAVRRAILRTVDFWMRLGVDGLRLDAVPYLFEREGTSCENLPETHEFLRELRRHVDAKWRGRMLLAEANQWPEDAAAYFGQGDECHMGFHFPLMPRLFMAMRMEERYPILEILQRTPPLPEGCQWALFLRNHDELTLEMVTDEERDYMYRVYAGDQRARVNLGIRRRLAPLLSNNRRKIELMHGLLFSLPGTPVLYYGDEIGMGDNIWLGDRDAVRTPMQWSADRNGGFSTANPQRLYLPLVTDPEYHHAAVNVEAQEANPQSLLWWTRRLVALRQRHRAFGRGSLEFLHPDNRKVLAFLRKHEGETILVVANLSRFVQPVSLDLSAYRGCTPVELFGRTRFPAVGAAPAFLTLGPHAFYWFALEPASQALAPPAAATPGREALPSLRTGATGLAGLAKAGRATREGALAALLRRGRWFRGRAASLRAARLKGVAPVPLPSGRDAAFVLVEAELADGEPETWALPLVAERRAAAEGAEEAAEGVLALLRPEGGHGPVAVRDACGDDEFVREVLAAIARRRRWPGDGGDVIGAPEPADAADALLPRPADAVRRWPARAGHATAVVGERVLLRLESRVEEGVPPQTEVARVLATAGSGEFPAPLGSLEWRTPDGGRWPVARVEAFLMHEGTLREAALDALSRSFERALSPGGEAPDLGEVTGTTPASVAELATLAPPAPAAAFLGTFLGAAGAAGRAVARFHRGVSAGTEDPSFAPEPVAPVYRRALLHAFQSRAARAFGALASAAARLAPDGRSPAARVLRAQDEADRRFRAFFEHEVEACRIRVHGSLTLDKILSTGSGCTVVDFSGDAHRPASERRLKRLALRDVCAVVRSFQSVAHEALEALFARGAAPERPEARAALESSARVWHRWAAGAFLAGWLGEAGTAPFVPPTAGELRRGLDAYLLDIAFEQVVAALATDPASALEPLLALDEALSEGP